MLDCSGSPLYREAFTLDPARGRPLARGVLSDQRGTESAYTLGSMLIVGGAEMRPLLAELQELLPASPGVAGGATMLPNNAGVGVRALGVETPSVREALTQCWAAARRRLIGAALPFLRKY